MARKSSNRSVQAIPTLYPRERDAHKGDFGRVLIVGGSVGMAGAPSLAANAALRGGAGLVKVACPEPVLPTVAGSAPCATSVALHADASGRISARAAELIVDEATRHDVVALGPGLGQSDELVTLVRTVIETVDRPMVIDADGLNNLAAIADWPRLRRGPTVLTPHPGEMKRLLRGAGMPDDVSDRAPTVQEFAAWCGQVVVLKGAGTLVSDGKRLYKNRTGNPGMATGGSGDVLTGLVAALIGQGLSPFEAAVLGVHLHGGAGDLAARHLGEISLIATDLIDCLPAAIRKHHARRRT